MKFIKIPGQFKLIQGVVIRIQSKFKTIQVQFNKRIQMNCKK